MKVGTLIDKYLKYMEIIKSASPLTIKSYSKDLQQALGPCKNDNLSPHNAQTLLMEFTRKAQMSWADLAPSSRNRKAATLKSFFAYLYAENLTSKNLGVLVQAPKVPKRIPHFISVDEVMAVLKTFDETTQDRTEKTLFLLLYGCGLRVSEACKIRWADFSDSSRSLRILGKGSKERLVIMPEGVGRRLAEIRSTDSGSTYIFGDSPMDPRKAYEIIRQRGLKAGLLKPLHPHALRHSFATHLLSSGANLRTLQELLGHESLHATEKYTHLGVDQLARTLESHHPFGNQRPGSSQLKKNR